MEKDSKVWVLRIEQVQNGEIISDGVFVYDNRDAAYQHFVAFAKDERQSIPTHWRTDPLDTAAPQGSLRWEAYDCVRYPTDHSCAELYCDRVRHELDFNHL